MKTLCIAILGLSFALGGCSSMRLPDSEFFKSDDIEDTSKLRSFPKVTEAPEAPTDIRSDAAWDKAARNLQKVRDEFQAPTDLKPVRSKDTLEREMAIARAKVHDYKKDDPQ